MNKYSKMAAVVLLCYISTGCNRAAESESTKISLQMPMNFSSTSFKGDVVAFVPGTTSGTFSEWSSITPTTVGDFNCYAAMVTGPEAYLNRNTCGRKNSTTGEIYSMIKFGPFVGAVLGGSSINLEVASGDNRIVTLVGFFAADTSACQNINLPGFDKSKLSKPYILGSSAPLSLKPTAVGGEAVNVPIAMSLNTEGWYDSCSGPEFDRSNQLAQATQVTIKKAMFPQNATLENSCSAFEIELKDSVGRTAASSGNTSIGITKIADTNTVGSSYETFSDCTAGTHSQNDFTITAGSTSAIRWIKTASVVEATRVSYKLFLLNSNLSVETLPPTLFMYNKVSTAEKLDLTGPSLINIYPAGSNDKNCYKYEIAYRNFDSVYQPGGSINQISISVPEGVTVNSQSDCSGVIGTPAITEGIASYSKFLSGGNYVYIFYIQFPGTGLYKLKTAYLSGTGHGMTSALSGELVVLATSTSSAIANFKIPETLILPKKASTCFGPFHLSLINPAGADVPNGNGSRSVSVDGGVGNNNFTLMTDCIGGSQINTSLTIMPNESNSVFYINTNGSPAASESTLRFFSGTLDYSVKVILN